MTIGCGLVLAGFAAENLAAHRRIAAGQPARRDALSVLGFGLPAAGLVLMTILAA